MPIGELTTPIDQKEREPFPKYPVFLPGAGSGTGRALARILAKEGYQVIAGSRSTQKIEGLAAEIEAYGGVAPIPFIADLTDADHVKEALEGLPLRQGDPVHFFPLAAGGLDKVMPRLMSFFIQVRKAARKEALTKDMLEAATNQIKAITYAQEAMDDATKINVTAPLALYEALRSGGHIGPKSVVATLSSTGSHQAGPGFPGGYRGPNLYYPVADSKAEGVEALAQRAAHDGARFIDFVAPEISDTNVGGIINGLFESISNVADITIPPIPTVTIDQVVSGMVAELTHPTGPHANDSRRTVFLTDTGVSHTLPSGWERPLLAYL